jgi:hypothetical protein
VLRKEELSSGCKTDCEAALLILPRRKRIRSEPSSALNQVNNEHNDGNHEQEMDQTAANVAKKAQKPEHDQDNNYSPEHGIPFVELNFRGPFIQKFIYSPSSFKNIESNGSPSLPQSWRVQGAVATAILDKRDQLANSVFT